MVTDRQNRKGIVIEAKGTDCKVRFDDNSERYYLSWMLKAAAGASEQPTFSSVPTGTYSCVAAGGIAGTLRLTIRSASEYGDSSTTKGNYLFDPATKKLTFPSGPWKGYYGALLASNKIGLSSRDNGYYGTVCDKN